MKDIVPNQYTNDESLIATKLKVNSIEDDFETFARFSWMLYTSADIYM